MSLQCFLSDIADLMIEALTASAESFKTKVTHNPQILLKANLAPC